MVPGTIPRDICICGYVIKNTVGALQNVCVKFTYVFTSTCPSLKHCVLLPRAHSAQYT